MHTRTFSVKNKRKKSTQKIRRKISFLGNLEIKSKKVLIGCHIVTNDQTNTRTPTLFAKSRAWSSQCCGLFSVIIISWFEGTNARRY